MELLTPFVSRLPTESAITLIMITSTHTSMKVNFNSLVSSSIHVGNMMVFNPNLNRL